MIPLKVKFIKTHPGAKLPTRGSEGAAGFDIYACETQQVWARRPTLIKTGLKIAVPEGYEAQVRPRSGLALKHCLTVLNSPGTIDEDYRGDLGVILMNHGTESFKVTAGMRIAQLVIKPVIRHVAMEEVEEFDETARGEGGFGSTGR